MKSFIYVYSNDNILNLEEPKELGFDVIEKSVQKFLEENKPHHFHKSGYVFILIPEEKLEEFSKEFLDNIKDFEFSRCESEINWNDIISKLNNNNIIRNGIIYNLYNEENRKSIFFDRKMGLKTDQDKLDAEDIDLDYDDDDDENEIFSSINIKDLNVNIKGLFKEAFDFISKKVKGQDEAVKSVSFCFARFIQSIKDKDDQPFSDHIILVGSSGSGKSEIARNLFDFIKEKKIKIKTERINASHISATGYRGVNIFEKIDEDKYGIFFIDELDKMFIQTGNEKDNYNQEKIANMLTVLENKKSFFIFAGVFKDLERIIEENFPREVRKLGFNLCEEKNEVKYFKTIDPLNKAMTTYALDSQEFIGRIPHIVKLNAINLEAIGSILDDAINTFSSGLKALGVDINIDEKCKKDILEIYSNDELSKDYGARYINKILAKIEEAVVVSENPQLELYKTLNELKSKLGIKQIEIHC